jgi:hypothetical protein
LRGGYVEYAGKNADGEGFEPPEPLRVRRFSKPDESPEITGNTAISAKRYHRRDQSCAELALIDRLLSALSGLNESSLRQVTELAESLSRSQSPEEVST